MRVDKRQLAILFGLAGMLVACSPGGSASRESDRATLVELKIRYDYAVGVHECLVTRGAEVDDDQVPSFEGYVNLFGEWSPYATIAETGSPDELKAALAACPLASRGSE